MRRIRLETSNRETGGGAFVAVVEILPFDDLCLPQVVVWGDRAFALHALAGEPLPVYREVLAIVSLTPSPGLPVEAGA